MRSCCGVERRVSVEYGQTEFTRGPLATLSCVCEGPRAPGRGEPEERPIAEVEPRRLRVTTYRPRLRRTHALGWASACVSDALMLASITWRVDMSG